MTNWDYALMAHEASLLGGPEYYLASIREAGYLDGLEKGALTGAAVTAVCGGIAVFAYTKLKKKRDLAAAAEAALLENMSQDRNLPQCEESDFPTADD